MIKIIRKYWSIYGGFSALFRSSYFWLGLATTALLFPAWSKQGWWGDVLSLLPNLLGFSLGGFAILLAVGDDGFKKLIAGTENGESSPYMDACTAFVHFIFLQIIALLIALIAKAYSSILPEYLPKVSLVTMSAIGYFIFIYSIYCTLAAVFAIFRVADWFDNYITKLNDSKKNNK
ncbi:hypothetical protein [Moellerella wisconsensis]|uniref:Uncharacterized protein n=1 Tax=Moellerella wisconsensis TaxID=158849 RepID=A0A9Q8Q3L3_9GAMM|nr:hypothetical protein [Moellerella wisconsensis]UNH31845.1 hypothetical protein MNY72_06030 [Moellerella wisconsensis]